MLNTTRKKVYSTSASTSPARRPTTVSPSLSTSATQSESSRMWLFCEEHKKCSEQTNHKQTRPLQKNTHIHKQLIIKNVAKSTNTDQTQLGDLVARTSAPAFREKLVIRANQIFARSN